MTNIFKNFNSEHLQITALAYDTKTAQQEFLFHKNVNILYHMKTLGLGVAWRSVTATYTVHRI